MPVQFRGSGGRRWASRVKQYPPEVTDLEQGWRVCRPSEDFGLEVAAFRQDLYRIRDRIQKHAAPGTKVMLSTSVRGLEPGEIEWDFWVETPIGADLVPVATAESPVATPEPVAEMPSPVATPSTQLDPITGYDPRTGMAPGFGPDPTTGATTWLGIDPETGLTLLGHPAAEPPPVPLAERRAGLSSEEIKAQFLYGASGKPDTDLEPEPLSAEDRAFLDAQRGSLLDRDVEPAADPVTDSSFDEGVIDYGQHEPQAAPPVPDAPWDEQVDDLGFPDPAGYSIGEVIQHESRWLQLTEDGWTVVTEEGA